MLAWTWRWTPSFATVLTSTGGQKLSDNRQPGEGGQVLWLQCMFWRFLFGTNAAWPSSTIIRLRVKTGAAQTKKKKKEKKNNYRLQAKHKHSVQKHVWREWKHNQLVTTPPPTPPPHPYVNKLPSQKECVMVNCLPYMSSVSFLLSPWKDALRKHKHRNDNVDDAPSSSRRQEGAVTRWRQGIRQNCGWSRWNATNVVRAWSHSNWRMAGRRGAETKRAFLRSTRLSNRKESIM